ncbi:MAG: DUF222 domain-containing protein [Candidatus Dormiibacterota bacterium]
MRSGVDVLLEGLRGAAEGVVDAGIQGLEPLEIREHLRSISITISILELARARDMKALEDVSAHEFTGAADSVGFFSVECRLAPEAVNDRVVLARQLDELPSTVEKLASGQISFDTAALVARNTAKMRPEHRPVVEAGILHEAQYQPPGQLRHVAAAIAAKVDSETLRRDARRAREKRSLKIGPDQDGMATVSGLLTSVCAAELRAALKPHMRPVDANDKRTAEQRRHDALQHLCQFGPGGHGRRAEVVVVAGVEAMTGESGAPPLLQGLVPISQEDFDVILEGADIRTVLRDQKGNQAYVGRKARTFSAPKRQAMLALSPTCAFHGCTRPAIDCTGHHIVEFGRGGETRIETGAPLCPAHQDRVHKDGWWVGSDGNGGFRTLPPGHPDNPKSRMTPDEYLRKRREAIFRRMAARGEKSRRRRSQGPAAVRSQPDSSPGIAPERAGPEPPAR